MDSAYINLICNVCGYVLLKNKNGLGFRVNWRATKMSFSGEMNNLKVEEQYGTAFQYNHSFGFQKSMKVKVVK